MKTEGPQQSKPGSPRRFVIVVLGLLVVLLVGQPTLRKWRESDKVQKQREWLRNAVQELDKVGPPPDDLGQPPPYYAWITQDYLIFSNGWAAYKIHTAHSSRIIGDITLLRLSDGRFYSSKLHYCVGLASMMVETDGELPRPADAEDFLKNCGRYQQWNLLSPDGRLRCAVICPDADSGRETKKALWVSISERDGNSETNLFERRYTFSGYYVAWTTRWNSNEVMAIDVFSYDRNPMTHSDREPELRTNHLATLEFHRDKQTGRFTDERR